MQQSDSTHQLSLHCNLVMSPQQRQPWLKALCFQVVYMSYFSERDISRTPLGIIIIYLFFCNFGKNVHLDLMN